MGRRKSSYPDLPPNMTARPGAGGKLLYYYRAGQKKIPLGADLARARVQWAQLENGVDAGGGFAAIAARYRKEILPGKSYHTQLDQGHHLTLLEEAFKGFEVADITPQSVRSYLDRRTKKIAANREIALLSHVWNCAREWGFTDRANPCAGVRKNREAPRERYVTDEEYKTAYDAAPAALQDAMDLILLTGQRPSDVLKMTRADVRDGVLWVRQAKTGQRLGVSIEGDLKIAIERMLARERDKKVTSVHLVADHNGQRVTIWALDKAFATARGTADWQLRDLRAKAATEAGNLQLAQQLLGHRSESTTAGIYRRIRGTVVKPLR